MAIRDLWYMKEPDENGNPVKSASYKKRARYRVSWSEGGRAYPSKDFDDLKAAKDYEASIRVDKASGKFVSKKAGDIPFRKFADDWLNLHSGRVLTKEHLESRLRVHVVEYFGDRKLNQIEQDDVLAWRLKLKADLADSTALVVFNIGLAIFKAAVAGKKLTDSPFEGVDPPKLEYREEVDPLPVELVQALIEAVPRRYRGLVVVGASAGLRVSEVMGLEVGHVAFLDRKGPALHVRQQLMTAKGRSPFLGPPKTTKSRRDVPMSQMLQQELARHLEEFPAREMRIDDDLRGKTTTRIARPIFTGPRGNPLWRQQVASMMRQARTRAFAAYLEGEGAKGPLERIHAEAQIAKHARLRFHDLRHFFASLLISQGASVNEVQACLGHSTPMQTLNTYSHLWPGSGDRTRSAVDAVLGGGRHLRVVA